MSTKITMAEYKRMTRHDAGRGKFGVAPPPERTWSGIWRGYHQSIIFSSKGEMVRFCELKILEDKGEIRNLIRQPRFEFGMKEFYVGDFLYQEKQNGNWVWICEDFKGMNTPAFKHKWPRVQETHKKIQFRVAKS